MSVLPFQLIEGQNLDKMRTAYHQINANEDIENILKMEQQNNAIVLAYKGAAEVMKAQYVFSPIAKYRSFKNGSKKIEESIKNKQTLENTYLRLIIQLNTPSFLGYDDSIKEDIIFFSERIHADKIALTWKKKFVETILKSDKKSVDLTAIKQISL
jgi:hypothetical protein